MSRIENGGTYTFHTLPYIISNAKVCIIYETRKLSAIFSVKKSFYPVSFQFSEKRFIPKLAEFASLVNKGDITVNAVLKHDIDYRGYEEMIGCDSACYCGTFDGTCHKILISIDDEDAGLALFRFVGKGGTIKNLHVEGEIHAYRERAGGIVGHMTDGTVSNCFCKVDIVSDHSGQYHYGGIVGRTEGKTLIINSVYNGHIIAPDGSDIGGLVGWVGSPGTTLRNSLASCDVVLRTLEGLCRRTILLIAP